MLYSDFRLALRNMRKNPAFTIIGLLTLALGIAAASTLFSVVDAVILRPLPYDAPERLVVLWTDDALRKIRDLGSSYPNYEDWRRLNHVFTDLAFSTKSSPVTLTGGDFPERIEGALVSSNLFQLMGVAPVLGRTFTDQEEQSGERLVLLSNSLWQRRFGGSLNVLDSTLQIDGSSARVIGVMPASFQFPSGGSQLWRPLGSDNNWSKMKTQRERPLGIVLGRLKSGVSVSSARSDMDLVASQLSQQFPDLARNPDFRGFRVTMLPLSEQVTGRDLRTSLWLLFAAVVLVLLIACANVANLLLARGTARRRELGVRVALGASRSRIITLLFTESIVLAGLSGIVGAGLTALAIRLVVTFTSATLPRADMIHLDFRVLAFAICAALISGVIFGLIPAWQAMPQNPREMLQEGSRSQTSAQASRRSRGVLVATEFALGMLLFCGAGLLMRSFLKLEGTPLGFATRDFLVFRLVLPGGKTDAQKAAFFDTAIEHLKTLPQTEDATAIDNFFLRSSPDTTILVEGTQFHTDEQVMDDGVSPEFFSTLKVPLKRGRFFSASDSAQTLKVAIINETLARIFWLNEDPIGRRFQFGDGRFKDPWITVVGIAGDMRRNGLERQPLAQVFLPLAQMPSRGEDLIVRIHGEPSAMISAVRHEIAALDPTVPVYQVSTLEQRLDDAISPRRFEMLLFGAFAAGALILAGLGMYGLMHYVVALRTNEIAIRVALGASRGRILLLIVRQGMMLALAGLLVGEAVAFAATRTMASLLYGVSTTDPLTFVAAPLILTLSCLLACVIPASKASRLNPVDVLRL